MEATEFIGYLFENKLISHTQRKLFMDINDVIKALKATEDEEDK